MIGILFDKHIPLRSMSVKSKKPPWLTLEIRNLIIQRDYAFKRWKYSRSEQNRKIYTCIRNKVTTTLRREKARYFTSELGSFNLSQRKFWGLINKMGLKDTSSSMCSQFSASDFACEFDSSKVSSVSCSSANINSVSTNADAIFSFKCIDEVELEKAVMSVTGNSIGLDLISIKFIKIILPVISKYLLYIINNAITFSCFPDLWKLAKLIPLPKNNNPKLVSDYRPISILSALSKVLEKVLKKQIVEYLEEYNLLDQYQSAYRKGYSTTTAILNIVDDVRRNADSGNATILVLLDFKKAFDSINFSILINKLSKFFNFSKSACKLILNYLTNRQFSVFIDDDFSNPTAVHRGVPQGSVLGPILFSLYINDLSNVLIGCKYHMFADDIQIYDSCNLINIPYLVTKINTIIANIEVWASENNLILNPKKTQSIVIYKNSINTTSSPTIRVCGVSIPFSDFVNDLGFRIE